MRPPWRKAGDRKGIEQKTRTWDKFIVDRTPELEEWAKIVRKVHERKIKIFKFANNHYAGFGPATVEMFRKIAKIPGADVIYSRFFSNVDIFPAFQFAPPAPSEEFGVLWLEFGRFTNTPPLQRRKGLTHSGIQPTKPRKTQSIPAEECATGPCFFARFAYDLIAAFKP